MPSGELRKLADDLRDAGDKAGRATLMAVRKSGKRVERGWKLNARLTARVHGKHYPSAVTTDVMIGPWITADIGPDKGKKQGPLGNLLEFGSRNNPAHQDGDRALMLETPRFIRAIEKAGELRL